MSRATTCTASVADAAHPAPAAPINGPNPIRRAPSGTSAARHRSRKGRRSGTRSRAASPRWPQRRAGGARARRTRRHGSSEGLTARRGGAGSRPPRRPTWTCGSPAGLAYIDRRVRPNEHYLYELRGVLADGTRARARRSTCPSGPGTSSSPTRRRGCTPRAATAGRWCCGTATRTPPPSSSQRSTSPGGPFQQVNPKPVAYDMDTDLDGAAAPVAATRVPRHRCWDADGLPHQPRGRGRRRSRPRQRHDLLVPGRFARHPRPGRVVVGGGRRPRPSAASRRWRPTTCRCSPTTSSRRARRHLAQGDAQRREPPAAGRRQTNLVYRADDPRGPRGPHHA